MQCACSWSIVGVAYGWRRQRALAQQAPHMQRSLDAAAEARQAQELEELVALRAR